MNAEDVNEIEIMVNHTSSCLRELTIQIAALTALLINKGVIAESEYITTKQIIAGEMKKLWPVKP